MCVAVAVVAGVFAGHSRAEDAPAAKTLRIGIPRPMFRDVPETLINAAAGPFEAMVRKKSGLKGSIHLLEDYAELARQMKEGKIDIGVFHGFEYAWIKHEEDLIPLVRTRPNCGKVQACVVVHKDTNITGPQDLKGQCVIVPDRTKAHCFMYLQHLQSKTSAENCCPLRKEGFTSQKALVEVGTQRAQAAIVDIAALDALKSNVPGCYRRLKVLADSESLPPAVVVYRKGSLNPDTVERIREGLIDCVNTGPGKVFAMFWQLEGFGNLDADYNALVENCLKAYPPPVPAAPPAPKE